MDTAIFCSKMLKYHLLGKYQFLKYKKTMFLVDEVNYKLLE